MDLQKLKYKWLNILWIDMINLLHKYVWDNIDTDEKVYEPYHVDHAHQPIIH